MVLRKPSNLKVLTWNDPRFAWREEDYAGINSMPLPFSDSWAPEVILLNAVEEKFMFRFIYPWITQESGHEASGKILKSSKTISFQFPF